MDFALTAEQRRIQQAARAFACEELAPLAAIYAPCQSPRQFFEELFPLARANSGPTPAQERYINLP